MKRKKIMKVRWYDVLEVRTWKIELAIVSCFVACSGMLSVRTICH